MEKLGLGNKPWYGSNGIKYCINSRWKKGCGNKLV